MVPTICDFAGVTPPENCKGISIRKIAAGKEIGEREFIVSEMNIPDWDYNELSMAVKIYLYVSRGYISPDAPDYNTFSIRKRIKH